ncbi:MAG: phosphate signaling complex protein PhoU [Verrucomicrobiota bacterium JB023]|nr:phosphate signaling complex protein PhoU [Verrucomicrobiota bacterium JB023]
MNSSAEMADQKFEADYIKLGRLISTMGRKTLRNLESAVYGLLKRDPDLCRTAIRDDDEIDLVEKEIDAIAIEILAQHQASGDSLRQVVSSMKVAASLERISDHAVNIAKRGKKMLTRNELSETQYIEPLYTLADGVLRDALASYVDSDADLGSSLRKRDKEIDRMHKELIGRLMGFIEQGGDQSIAYLHLIFVIRSLERVGDLAVNIGEDAVFLDRAEDIRYAKHATKKTAEDKATL